MFINPAPQIISHANIERAISLVGQNINVVLIQNILWIPELALNLIQYQVWNDKPLFRHKLFGMVALNLASLPNH